MNQSKPRNFYNKNIVRQHRLFYCQLSIYFTRLSRNEIIVILRYRFRPALVACDVISNNAAEFGVCFAPDPELMLYQKLWKVSCYIIVQIAANMISDLDEDTHTAAVRKILRELP